VTCGNYLQIFAASPNLIVPSTGACILYGISRVVIGENKTFLGGEAYLKQRGIEVVILEDKECQDLMEKFIKEKPEVWYITIPMKYMGT
jgi:hypothetical protein